MKSLFSFLLALLVTGSLASHAQTAPATQAPMANHAAMTTDHAPKEGKMKMAKTKSSSTMMSGGAGPMKKDGTPDMRYKANRKAKM